MLVPSTGANISGKSVRMSIRKGMGDIRAARKPRFLQCASMTSPRITIRGLYLALPLRAGRCRFRSRRCRGGAFSLLFTLSRGGRFGLTGLGQAQALVLDAALFQQRRNRFRRDRAMIQPVLAAIQLRHELL